MANLKQEQICPYCNCAEEDCHSHWDEEATTVNCSSCYKEYHVTTHYTFDGFETQKICEGCHTTEDDCFCEVDEGEE